MELKDLFHYRAQWSLLKAETTVQIAKQGLTEDLRKIQDFETMHAAYIESELASRIAQ